MQAKLTTTNFAADTDGAEALPADGQRVLLQIQPQNGDVRVRFLQGTDGEVVADVGPILIVSGRLYPFEKVIPTNAIWIEAVSGEVDVTILSASRA